MQISAVPLHYQADAASSSTSNKPELSVQAVGEGTLVTGTRVSALPSCSQTASCSSAPSTPGTGQLPVGSQALRDLMELAEDGMTLTQYGYSAKGKTHRHVHFITSGVKVYFHSSKWLFLTVKEVQI